MSAKNKNLSQHKELSVPNAAKYRIALVVSEYNEPITSALHKGCIDALKKYGVKEKNILVEMTPGAYELPLAAKWMYEKRKADAVIALGCVIKGDTDHDIYINISVSQALMALGLETKAPFVFGVITPNTLQQAKDRAGGKHGNKGVECAIAALKMLALKDSLKK
jgi:6,7-dimethyl-8-ribityllumazine synthase